MEQENISEMVGRCSTDFIVLMTHSGLTEQSEVPTYTVLGKEWDTPVPQ